MLMMHVLYEAAHFCLSIREFILIHRAPKLYQLLSNLQQHTAYITCEND